MLIGMIRPIKLLKNIPIPKPAFTNAPYYGAFKAGTVSLMALERLTHVIPWVMPVMNLANISVIVLSIILRILKIKEMMFDPQDCIEEFLEMHPRFDQQFAYKGHWKPHVCESQ